MNPLGIAWYFMLAAFFSVYAILAGFDLGVGILCFFAKDRQKRKSWLSTIGSFWDGNEVWLLFAGGALFAVFPKVYASLLSGLYLPFILIIFSLAFRALGIEFRNKSSSEAWQNTCDISIFSGSTIVSVLFGVAVGNILLGFGMDANMNFSAGILELLNPPSILAALVVIAFFISHGASFLRLKIARTASIAYVSLFSIFAFAICLTKNSLCNNYKEWPVLILVPACVIVFGIAGTWFNKKDRRFLAMAALALSAASAIFSVAAALYPVIIPSSAGPELSLTIMNSASSPLALKAMSIIAILGVPLVLGYNVWIYRAFYRFDNINSK